MRLPLLSFIAVAACAAPRPLAYDAYAERLLAQHRKHRSLGRLARADLTRNDRIDAHALAWLDPSVRELYGSGEWNLRGIVNDWLCFETRISSALHRSMVQTPVTAAELDAIDRRDLDAYRRRMRFTIVALPLLPSHEPVWPSAERDAIDDIRVARGDFIGRARDRHWQLLTLCGPAPVVPDDASYLGLVVAGAASGPQLVLWQIDDAEQ